MDWGWVVPVVMVAWACGVYVGAAITTAKEPE